MEERTLNTIEVILLVITVIFILFNSLGRSEASKKIRQQICKQVYTNTNDYINCSHRPIEETIELLKPIKQTR